MHISNVDQSLNEEVSRIWLVGSKCIINYISDRLLVYTYTKNTSPDQYLNFKINNDEIEQVSPFPFLRIILDENISWKQ